MSSLHPLPHCLHVDLDGAWPQDIVPLEYRVDARAWGPVLRYSATSRGMDEFYAFIRPKLAPFVVFGSGDFHHLSALWLRRIEAPFTLISFDNHPDWDTRPPRWGCGTWINRALELPHLQTAAIWGCGNFELNWPGYLYVNRPALEAQRVAVYPWTERLRRSGRQYWGGVTRENWREFFSRFVRGLTPNVYVTVDLDCLDEAESAGNWEHGLFSAADIAWALRQIRSRATVIGGDLLGAYSPPRYERWLQKLAANRDHPDLPIPTLHESAARNLRAFHTIWEALTGRNQAHSDGDQ